MNDYYTLINDIKSLFLKNKNKNSERNCRFLSGFFSKK